MTVLRAALAWEPAPGLRITPGDPVSDAAPRNASDNFFVGLSDPGDGVFRTSTPEYRGTKDRFILPTLNAKYDFGGVSADLQQLLFQSRRNLTGYSGTLYDLSYYQSCYLDGCGFQHITARAWQHRRRSRAALSVPHADRDRSRRLPYYQEPLEVVTNTQRDLHAGGAAAIERSDAHG